MEDDREPTEAGDDRGEFDSLRAPTARRSLFEPNPAPIASRVSLGEADVTPRGLRFAEGGFDDAPNIEAGAVVGPGLREQATGGE